MTKRIAIIKSRFHHSGGLEKVARYMAQSFADRECEVHVLTTRATHQEQDYDLVSFPEGYPLSFLRLEQFDRNCSRWLKENPMDVVFGMDRTRKQTHYRAGNGVHAHFLRLRRQQDSPLRTLSIRYNPLHRNLLDIERGSFEDPLLRTIFTNSHMVEREIRHYYDVPSSKIRVVHNGVQWNAWQDHFDLWEEEKERGLAAQRLEKGPFYFLFVGHGYKRKGLAELLRGLALVRERGAHLLVAGREKNEAPYKILAQKLGLEKRVHFLGPQKSVVPLLQIADSLVVPSLYDPFANVTVEALAMGLFVVSGRGNGGHEVLTLQSGRKIKDVSCPELVAKALRMALDYPKTFESSLRIRQAYRSLDYSKQLDKMVNLCLS